MKQFEEEFIAKVSRTELDLEFPFYLNPDEEDTDYIQNEVEIPYEELGFADEVPSMDIDEVIQILSDFKNKGANRVYIATHVDHHGYYFYGIKLKELI